MPLKFPKPLTRRTVKRKRRVVKNQQTAAIREQVFTRDCGRCRVCGGPATSMHELRPRSLGGTVSLENSIAVCGSGTTGCHGRLQRHEVTL